MGNKAFSEKLTYNAAISLLSRVHRDLAGASIRMRNYTHGRIMKDKDSLDGSLAELVHDALMSTLIQLNITEDLLGRLVHDECKRRVAKAKKEKK